MQETSGKKTKSVNFEEGNYQTEERRGTLLPGVWRRRDERGGVRNRGHKGESCLVTCPTGGGSGGGGEGEYREE